MSKKVILVAVAIVVMLIITFVANQSKKNENFVPQNEPSSETAVDEKKATETQSKSQDEIVGEHLNELNKGEISFQKQMSLFKDGKEYTRYSLNGSENDSQYIILQDDKVIFSHGRVPFSLDGYDCTQLIAAGYPIDFDSITDICK